MSFDWWFWAGLLVVVLLVYLRSLAGRLDRLHVRLEAAKDALDAQLVRRSAAATEVANSGLLDPATSTLIAQAAYDAGRAKAPVREVAESDLSRALRAALDDSEEVELLRAERVGATLLDDLGSASSRVVLARNFHNDAVRATLQIRKRRVVRWLRLAGTAPWPRSFDMDDTPPVRLVR